ncbi:hypothetical protein EJ110_NYTH39736 [Nymphaea thermarum]|nr:hypothetical protein EJ110_NYTH39736 [Nymphaea thermarum]
MITNYITRTRQNGPCTGVDTPTPGYQHLDTAADEEQIEERKAEKKARKIDKQRKKKAPLILVLKGGNLLPTTGGVIKGPNKAKIMGRGVNHPYATSRRNRSKNIGESKEKKKEETPAKEEKPTEAESLHSMQDPNKSNSFRVFGRINGQKVLILLDNGATRNFLTEEAAKKCNIALESSRPQTIIVGGGLRLKCLSEGKDMEVVIKKKPFKIDFLVIPLDGVDLILGPDPVEAERPEPRHRKRKCQYNYEFPLIVRDPHLPGFTGRSRPHPQPSGGRQVSVVASATSAPLGSVVGSSFGVILGSSSIIVLGSSVGRYTGSLGSLGSTRPCPLQRSRQRHRRQPSASPVASTAARGIPAALFGDQQPPRASGQRPAFLASTPWRPFSAGVLHRELQIPMGQAFAPGPLSGFAKAHPWPPGLALVSTVVPRRLKAKDTTTRDVAYLLGFGHGLDDRMGCMVV